MHKLKIGPDFSLALELVTTTQAILARKRSGKSYTASVEAEELLSFKQQVVVIDPTSAWWGLRSSADGNGEGYPVIVFGGDHADAPLDYRAGKAMVAAVVEHGFSAIFDIGNFETDEQIQFVMDFCKELLRVNRTAIHVFMDEADTFAPQMLESSLQKKCLGTVARLVKQGGIRGVGFTMITQRSADLNKKILSQVDLLTVLRMSHPLDIKAVTDWIKSEVGPEYALSVEKALPSLPVGTAYFCSASLDIAERVQVRQRNTFNSGATPKPGERKVEPKVMAKVDIAKLGERIAASVKKAQEESPEFLLKEIERLKNLAPASTTNEEETKVLKEKLEEISGMVSTYEDRMARDQAKFDRIALIVGELMSVIEDRRPPSILRNVIPVIETTFPRPGRAIAVVKNETGIKLPAGEREILVVLAQYPDGLDREQISVFSGYTKKSTRDAYLQRLQQKGYVTAYAGGCRITSEGVVAVGEYERLPQGKALLEYWLAKLPKGERDILACLWKAKSNLTPEQISEQTGYEAKSTRDAYIQRLGQKLLVKREGGIVRASANLY